MRLLFLNHNIAFRGTFFRAHQLAREMVCRGHDVTLVTTSPRARFRARWREIDGVPVLEAPDLLPGPGRSGWDGWNTLRRILSLRPQTFDIIHAFDSRPVVLAPALMVRRRTGAALVMDWADWWGRGGRIDERSGAVVRTLFGPVETWFEEAFRLRADRATVISAALETRLAGMGYPPERILRVPNGSDTTGIVPGDRRLSRERLDVPASAPLVVHIGVLTEGDLALVLGAFSAVRRRHPTARLVLLNPRIGAGSHPGVTTTGFVAFDVLKDWLSACDLGLVALGDTIGNRGRWPGRLNDFLAAGRPVVVTRVGDAPGYVEGAGAGWSAAPESAGLGERMAKALSDRAGLEAAGRRARVLAETELSWPRIADLVERTYEQVQ